MEQEQSSTVMMRLIEKATNSTDRDIEPRLLKAIKSAARSSEYDVRVAVHVLMDNMKKEHSQVRYLSLIITDELFMRSKLFRSLLVVNLEHFLTLSVGFRRNMPLPPPAAIASLLRSKSIELLEKWNTTFGVHYRQLRLGLDYLKNTLRFQFPNRLENEARLQQDRREREMRSREILLSKFEKLKDNFSIIKSEIHSTLDQLGECLDIVSVREDEFGQNNLTADDEFDSTEFKLPALQQIRLHSLKEGAKIHENCDNKAIFDAMRELHKLLVSKHMQTLQECISVLVRVDLQNNRFRDFALKELIDMRNLINSAKLRCEQTGGLHEVNLQEDEELWEEGKIIIHESKASPVPSEIKEEYSDSQRNIENKHRPAYREGLLASVSNDESANSLTKAKNKGKVCCKDLVPDKNLLESTPLRSKLLAEAPVVPWGSSLDYWGSNHDALANQRGLELDNHWGRVDQDAVIPASKIAELNVHVTAYKEPAIEIQPCLSPLKKGGLCQRRDLKVCPFHGPIIPRDAYGNPLEQKVEVADAPEKDISTLEDEKIPDSSSLVANELAKQAVKNVRKRDNELKALKRARVHQHNEAVLREAAAVASSSYLEGLSDDIGTSSAHRTEAKLKKPTLASMLTKKVTTKDRLTQKLLSARVTDATIRQLTQAEDAAYKEAYPNQW